MSAYASVIIPTYNRHSTLRYAVASIQAQSVDDIEILIVGDGATASVAEIARSVADQDSRVRFLEFVKEARDGGPNCHRGVLAASGERIFYCDDDDLWLPQHVATLGPQLDRYDVADTMPVSVGSAPVGGETRLHATLVNSGAEHVRSLLAQNKLKLTYDTHVAHRKSSYLQLGTPWIASSGPSVTHMLATFARSDQIRWKTLPLPTALSLHGAARLQQSDTERGGEIDLWLRKISSMSPDTLSARLDFCWHFMRTLWSDAPSDQSLADYLTRAGVCWTETGADFLPAPLTNAQRRSIENVYHLFQGHRLDRTSELSEIIFALLDNVLGGQIPVEYSLKLLRPFGADGAVDIVRTIGLRKPDHRVDLLLGHCLCEAQKMAEAREVAARLSGDDGLPDYDLTRLLVRIDLAEGAHEEAILRLEHAWRESPSTFVAGLELASTLLALGRAQRAREVCRELEPVAAGHEWLESLKSRAAEACAEL